MAAKAASPASAGSRLSIAAMVPSWSLESGHRVSTRKPLRKAQPIAFGTAVQVFPGYTREPVDGL